MPIPYRILLVDDDDLVREVLGIRLARREYVEIVGSVASGEEALLATERLRPDVVVLDLCLPGLSGMDTLRTLVKSHPQIRVIVLSANESPDQVQQAFERGASGYVVKHLSGFDLHHAIQAVRTGCQYRSPAICSNAMNAGGSLPAVNAS
jgi:DNA-binding NarL/FixJ family response regulator